MAEQRRIPDVIEARSFQMVDDEGNVRAELRCRTMERQGTVSNIPDKETQPVLELRDSLGDVRFSVSLGYFDQPLLEMGDVDFADGLDGDPQGSMGLMVGNGGVGLVMRDANGVERVRVVVPSQGTRQASLTLLDNEGQPLFIAGHA